MSEPPCARQGVPHGPTESGGIALADICWSPCAQILGGVTTRQGVVVRLYLPTFNHFFIVNNFWSSASRSSTSRRCSRPPSSTPPDPLCRQRPGIAGIISQLRAWPGAIMQGSARAAGAAGACSMSSMSSMSTPLPSQLTLNKLCILTRASAYKRADFFIRPAPFTLPPHRRHRVAVSLCRSRAYDSPVGACWLCGHRALQPRLANLLSTATPRKPKNKNKKRKRKPCW
jgi:hypothetical protein